MLINLLCFCLGGLLAWCLFKVACKHEYDREKRAERIKRELDEKLLYEDMTAIKRMVVYCIHPADVEAIINGKSYRGYLTRSRVYPAQARYDISLIVNIKELENG